MKVFSFINPKLQEQEAELSPVEVEVCLTPGLPVILFLGRADAAIKESEARIRSALLQQGFQLPAAKQVLINLRPNHLKKSSRGLDLAVAACILWETGQLPVPTDSPLFIYGELSLTGEVLPPDDLSNIDPSTLHAPLITGPQENLPIKTAQVHHLRDLANPAYKKGRKQKPIFKRPPIQDWEFPETQAKLLKIIACGEHSALLTGPAGTGKTTCAQQVSSLLRPPDSQLRKDMQKIWKNQNTDSHWRPMRSPHHSTPPISMVGGGTPPLPGEISRAHGGVLLLDELLEFQVRVLDALREPIESGSISISRKGSSQRLPADFLLLATSNLCPCSEFVPKQKNKCSCRLLRRRTYLERLSGPLLDRFQILAFIPRKLKPYVTLKEVFEEVQKAIDFAKERRDQIVANRHLSLSFFDRYEDEFLMTHLLPELGQSRRRKLALLQVARTLADLERQEKIRPRHIHESSQLTLQSFADLADSY